MSRQMEIAVSQRRIDRFRKIMSRRRSLLERLFRLADTVCAERVARHALQEDQRWLQAFGRIKHSIEKRMEKNKRDRSALRMLGAAYEPPSRRRSLISTRG